MGDLKEWLGILALAVSVGGTLYAWLTRSGKEAGEHVAKLELQIKNDLKDRDLALKDRDDKINSLEDRVSRLEGEINHLPDRDTVHRMELSLSEMRGDLKAMTERLVPVASISDRLQEFLLGQAHK